MEKKTMFMADIDTIFEVFELAKAHGKKAGDNIQSEFDEILKKKPEKFKCLGTTDQDSDMLTGNLREKGLKIVNLNEIERRKKNEQVD